MGDGQTDRWGGRRAEGEMPAELKEMKEAKKKGSVEKNTQAKDADQAGVQGQKE
jgi:hypothetical protein